MSEYTVKLPDVGEGVAEAEIVEWHIAVGDTIDEDAVMVDVMSDKATIELPSPVSGTVRWIAGEIGDVIAVGSSLVVIDVDSEVRDSDAEPVAATTNASTSAEVSTSVESAGKPPAPTRAVRSTTSGDRPTAAPAVRACAAISTSTWVR